MSNKFEDIDIKNCTYYFFAEIINIKIFDSKKIKIFEKSYKDIFIYCIEYVIVKDSKYIKTNII